VLLLAERTEVELLLRGVLALRPPAVDLAAGPALAVELVVLDGEVEAAVRSSDDRAGQVAVLRLVCREERELLLPRPRVDVDARRRAPDPA
jgi:hypothetical protein